MAERALWIRDYDISREQFREMLAGRLMNKYERIVSDPEIMLGKPVIRGTRIPVELLVRKMGEGATEEESLDAYPNLRREDFLAALKFAADLRGDGEIVSRGSKS